MTIQALALRGAVFCATAVLLSGCLAGMVVGAIIPDGDKDEKKKR